MSESNIDLSFGPESVKPDEYKPLDEGIYPMYCSDVKVTMTNAGEQMIVLEWTVTGDVRAGAKIRNDNLVIPGAQRKSNDPDKWNMMMNMLRDRLEAITGRDWADDNMKLNPFTDLGGAQIKAIVVQNPYDYMKDGERKQGVGNSIKKYLRPDDNSTKFTPSAAPQFTPSQGNNSQPQEQAPTSSGGSGFAL